MACCYILIVCEIDAGQFASIDHLCAHIHPNRGLYPDSDFHPDSGLHSDCGLHPHTGTVPPVYKQCPDYGNTVHVRKDMCPC